MWMMNFMCINTTFIQLLWGMSSCHLSMFKMHCFLIVKLSSLWVKGVYFENILFWLMINFLFCWHCLLWISLFTDITDSFNFTEDILTFIFLSLLVLSFVKAHYPIKRHKYFSIIPFQRFNLALVFIFQCFIFFGLMFMKNVNLWQDVHIDLSCCPKTLICYKDFLSTELHLLNRQRSID